ncbi:hypothetical protein [Flavobacterium sp. HJSW_4]|uniref:hypothetical protein n=1 Tax=Flavobacterium sp. HJSW_4 TaxID=3344660 RepID=UPI0035F2A6D1
MTGFTPLDFLTAVVSPSLTEPIKENWDTVVFELAEKAKDKGLRGVDVFLRSSGGGEDRYAFGTTAISQEILNKLLNGEFKNLKDLQQQQLIKNDYQSALKYTLFHYMKKK